MAYSAAVRAAYPSVRAAQAYPSVRAAQAYPSVRAARAYPSLISEFAKVFLPHNSEFKIHNSSPPNLQRRLSEG